MKMWLERIGFLLAGAALAGAAFLFLPVGGPGSGAVLTDPEARDDARTRRMALAEERFRTEMNIALAGFLRLIEFRDFGERGRDVALIVPLGGRADRADVLQTGARRGIRVPRIVVDTAARRRWALQGERLERLRGDVDPDVDAAFAEILDFLRGHPFPSSPDLSTVSRSEWSRPAVVERWVDLNDTLVGAAVAVISRFGTAP